MVDFECGNPDCQEQFKDGTEEHDFKDGQLVIEATPVGKEAKCDACESVNYTEGFKIAKL